MRFHRAFLHNLKNQIAQGSTPSCFASHVLKVWVLCIIAEGQVQLIFSGTSGRRNQWRQRMWYSSHDHWRRSRDHFFRLADIFQSNGPSSGGSAESSTGYKVNFESDFLFQYWRRAELDLVVGKFRLPDWEDERSLPYLRALIKEVHRWAPIASVGVPHATIQSNVYAGFTIPKGTIVYPNLIALSRDSDRYSAPDSFQPDRFLGDDLDASASAQQADYHKRDHFHYGFGRRLCQGIFVAETSLFIFISRTLWGFNIAPLEGEPPLDMNAKTSKIEFFPISPIALKLIDLSTAGSVNRPQPYRVDITSRGPEYEATIKRCMANAKSDIESVDDLCWSGLMGSG